MAGAASAGRCGAAIVLACATLLACARPADDLRFRPVESVLTPDELRAEVHERVPELPRDEIPVLFEVDPEIVERVRARVQATDLPVEQIRTVVRAVTDPNVLGLVYDRGSLGTARETIAAGRGNCLSLAAVLVGVARGLGWKARFTELSLRDDEIFYEADVAISEEHMGVKLSTESATLYIDYSGRMSVRSRVMIVTDLRATAQYYNNHAYDLVHENHVNDRPVPWTEVASRFEIATRIEPGFAQAWNNLGVARNRLGDVEGAEYAYERAIEVGGRTESAERNLRLLHGLPPESEAPAGPGLPSGWEPFPEE